LDHIAKRYVENSIFSQKTAYSKKGEGLKGKSPCVEEAVGYLNGSTPRMSLTLFLLAKPPLEVFSSLFLALILFGFEFWPQLPTEFEQFLRVDREPAALAHVAFCSRHVFHLATTLGAVRHI